MQVVATATGFYGRLIFPDTVFEVPDDEEASTWFTPVEPAKAAKTKKASPAAPAEPGDSLT